MDFHFLDGFKTCPTEEITAFQPEGQSQMVMITKDLDSMRLAVDTSGNLFILDSKSGEVIETLDQTLSAYLESFRDQLILGKLIFEVESGFMSTC